MISCAVKYPTGYGNVTIGRHNEQHRSNACNKLYVEPYIVIHLSKLYVFVNDAVEFFAVDVVHYYLLYHRNIHTMCR